MESVTVTGAYGRDYKSKAAVLDDWENNMDFKIVDGPYINKSDAERYNVQVRIRYDQLRKVLIP